MTILILKFLETLQIAKAKLKKAEHTSDLSTTEEVCIREKKTKIPDPPMYSSHNIMETSNVQKGKLVLI